MPLTTARGARRAAGLLAALAAVTACAPPATPATPLPTVTSTPTGPAPGSPTAAPPTTTAAPASTAFAHQPLWPFATAAEVSAWQAAHRSGGAQPWHLDAGATALAFVQGYLGFGELGQVTSTQLSGSDAWIGVGQRLPNGANSTAAVVHLARWGTGPDAPWEVAGTRDTTLTIETPAYGAPVGSPLTVGGHVTGVDENLRVQVRRPGSETPLGEACCLPAGGENSPWSTTVRFSGATGEAMTVVVSTGGHVAQVERFAVTGVRSR